MATGGVLDDFSFRVSKKLQQRFVQDVNPVNLMLCLTCLKQIDEEVVKAKCREYGDTTGATELWDRLIRQTNWYPDLLTALRNPFVGQDFLADEFEKMLLTIPARWYISGFRDDSGTACFNGLCDDGRTEPMDTSEETEVGDASETTETAVANPATSQPQENLAVERERIRNVLYEQAFSSIRSPNDLPLLHHYLPLLEMQLMHTDLGSILVNIYVSSVEALENLEYLWKYGGLKRMLDKELLSDDMIKMFEKTAEEMKHHVTDIQSHVEVYDTDLLRCRAWLGRTQKGVQPKDFTFGAVQKKSTPDTREPLEAAKYVRDRLPEEFLDLLEDPFFSDRICSFYESKSVRQKIKCSGDSQNRSVLDLFMEWFDEEMSQYLKASRKVGSEMHNMFVAASFLVEQSRAGKRAEVPLILPADLHTVAVVKRKESVRTKGMPSKCFDEIIVPDVTDFDRETIDNACSSLTKTAVLSESKGKFVFKSKLLRDVYVTKVAMLDESLDAATFGRLCVSVENFQTLLGMYEDYWKLGLLPVARARLESHVFKTELLKTIRGSSVKLELKTGNGLFINEDLLLNKKVQIHVSEDMAALSKHSNEVTVNTKQKLITVDIGAMSKRAKVPPYNVLSFVNRNAFLLEQELELQSLVPYTPNSEHTLSLTAKDLDLEKKDIKELGLFLNVSPTAISLNLKNCNLSLDKIQTALHTGHFRNIHHLLISDNPGLKEATQPLGLMYMSALESLEVQNCQLGDEGVTVLAQDLRHLIRLRELNVANNQMSSKGLLELSKGLSGCKGLTVLKLQNNILGKDGVFVLTSWLKELRLLEVLNISDCKIADKGASVLACALVSKSLRKLSIRNNGFSSKGSHDFFQNFERPEAFVHIDFSKNTLFTTQTRSDVELLNTDVDPFLTFLQGRSSFTHLSFWSCGLGIQRIFQSAESFAASFGQLNYLCLQENNLRDEFVVDLAHCINQHSKYLQHLNLRQNFIGNNGAKHLARALAIQSFLEETFLDRNVIGDEGASELVQACTKSAYFTSLDLSCNNTTKQIMSTIAQSMEELNKTLQEETFSEHRKRKFEGGDFDENALKLQKIDGRFVIVGDM